MTEPLLAGLTLATDFQTTLDIIISWANELNEAEQNAIMSGTVPNQVTPIVMALRKPSPQLKLLHPESGS